MVNDLYTYFASRIWRTPLRSVVHARQTFHSRAVVIEIVASVTRVVQDIAGIVDDFRPVMIRTCYLAGCITSLRKTWVENTEDESKKRRKNNYCYTQ